MVDCVELHSQGVDPYIHPPCFILERRFFVFRLCEDEGTWAENIEGPLQTENERGYDMKIGRYEEWVQELVDPTSNS